MSFSRAHYGHRGHHFCTFRYVRRLYRGSKASVFLSCHSCVSRCPFIARHRVASQDPATAMVPQDGVPLRLRVNRTGPSSQAILRTISYITGHIYVNGTLPLSASCHGSRFTSPEHVSRPMLELSPLSGHRYVRSAFSAAHRCVLCMPSKRVHSRC